MVGVKLFCFSAMLALASAGWGGCPYLKEVVPQGEIYMNFAADFVRYRATDCAAFAQQFAKHANITTVCGKTGAVFQVQSSDIQQMCKLHQFPPGGALTLKGVFPAFRRSSMIFEVDFQSSGRSGSGLAQLHFCRKTNKVVSARVLKGESSNVPESLRQSADRLLKATFETHDCGDYADLMENDAAIEYNGEPKLVSRGGQNFFENMRLAQAACEEKARREKRVILSSSVVGQKYFYDASQKELSVVAEKSTEVIFRPGQTRTSPIVVVLQFSEVGKIKAVHFYETEVLHIEQKHGLEYGASDSSTRDFTYHAHDNDEKQQNEKGATVVKPAVKEFIPKTPVEKAEAEQKSKANVKVKVQMAVTEPSPEDVDLEHAFVGVLTIKGTPTFNLVAAANARGSTWFWMVLLALTAVISQN